MAKAKSLVVVEFPAKATTINKILGTDFIVKSCMGHVRDLSPKELGVDANHDFAPHYVTIRGKGKVLTELRSAAKGVKTIYLATDPDREGEAIAWHVAHAIAPKWKSSEFCSMRSLRRPCGPHWTSHQPSTWKR